MSKDVIRPLMKAVADLPPQYTGLVLSIVNALRSVESEAVAERLKNALAPPYSEVVVLTAIVYRNLTLKQALAQTRLPLHITDQVVESWPVASGDSIFVIKIFHKFGRHIEAASLEVELAAGGLELDDDLVGLAAINQAHPEFAKKSPNGTQRKDAAGRFCYALFDKYGVNIRQDASGWSGDCWFQVRPKQAT